jgi:hypothetical protein
MDEYRCKKCNAQFDYKSHLERHMNRLTPCNMRNHIYRCDLCNIEFKHKSRLDAHNNSKKHINNYNVYIQNIENLTINYNDVTIINAFEETNLNILNEHKDIDDVYLTNIHLNEMFQAFEFENNIYASNNYFVYCFDYFIKIFTKLNFNLAFSENHNCNIYSFERIGANQIKYNIITVDIILKTYVWQNNIEYEIFIIKFLDLMIKIDIKFNNKNFKKVLDYVLKYKNKYLLNDDYTKIEIEKKLIKEYNNFEKLQSEEDELQRQYNQALLEHNRKHQLRLDKINQAMKLQGMGPPGLYNNIKN